MPGERGEQAGLVTDRGTRGKGACLGIADRHDLRDACLDHLVAQRVDLDQHRSVLADSTEILLGYAQVETQAIGGDQKQHVRTGVDAFAEIGIALGDHAAERRAVIVAGKRRRGIGTLRLPALEHRLEYRDLGFAIARFARRKGFLPDQLLRLHRAPLRVGKIRLGLVLGGNRLGKLEARQFVIELEQHFPGLDASTRIDSEFDQASLDVGRQARAFRRGQRAGQAQGFDHVAPFDRGQLHRGQLRHGLQRQQGPQR